MGSPQVLLTIPILYLDSVSRPTPTTRRRPRTAARRDPSQLELADRRDALFAMRSAALRGDAVAFGDLEMLTRVSSWCASCAAALAVVAVDLERDVHHAAGVHRVVGRVEMRALHSSPSASDEPLVFRRRRRYLATSGAAALFVHPAASAQANRRRLGVVRRIVPTAIAPNSSTAAAPALVDVGDLDLGAGSRGPLEVFMRNCRDPAPRSAVADFSLP